MVRWLSCFCLLQIVDILHAVDDYRHISYEDLQSKILFRQDGVSTYSQLLFDVSRQQVVVGARDNLYRLTLNSLTILEHAVWAAPSEKSSVCQDKGQSAEDCHNYIKVLLSNGKSLFTCGTNAFSPLCTWREIENINNVTSKVKGITICPHSPRANVTALLGRPPSGGLFTGTPTDFSGLDFGIFRSLATPNLRTPQYDSKWLNDPQFVGSFEIDQHIYFLFRETAVEYINCGKKVYSRIARVCKNDPGGQPILKDLWATFAKARLNCSIPGEFPFYYDEIQGAVYQADKGIVYATFTTPNNAIAGSAICAFNMSSITESFNGYYKHQKEHGTTWEKVEQPKSKQQCDTISQSKSYHVLENVKYQLMDKAVQSTTLAPLHTAVLERFTHIAVDVIQTKYGSVTVLYVATTTGLIKKISVLPRSQETCIVEVWGPLPSPPIVLQFLKDTQSLYIGMETGLLRILATRCHRHKGRQSCLNAQDPYCGWDELSSQCHEAPNQNHLVSHWKQEMFSCPILTDPVNGGWSAWSAWNVCLHDTADNTHTRTYLKSIQNNEDNMDKCQCQTRVCNNPPPQNGGADCVGSSVRVTNCTVHGGWTAWSPWSTCSSTCGLAMKTKRRTCTNPSPAFGGRVCLGHDHNEAICINLQPCPTQVKPSTLSQAAQWSAWGQWGVCSKLCNSGIRVRKRICSIGESIENNSDCPGCNVQVEDCNTHSCPETRRYSGWTPWLMVNNSQQANALGYTEKRFRFNCKAQTDDPSSVKVQTKEEERYCRSTGSCLRGGSSSEGSIDISDGWTEWSVWSPCTKSCDSGYQTRVRKCETQSCEGMSTENRQCNTNPCQRRENDVGQWSCWTDWTECSVSCGVGFHTRSRECLGGQKCQGPMIVKETCEMPSCESLYGWDNWSKWSSCTNNQQQRRRKCLEPNVCHGHNQESRDCFLEYINSNEINVAGISVGVVVGSCIAGFVIGLALTGVLCLLYLKHRSKPRIPGNPHYITKLNSYVTVPMKEISTKRQSSFSGTLNGNGTLRGKNNGINGVGSPKLYPKSLDYESATLKRNSHNQAYIRAELDQEKYY